MPRALLAFALALVVAAPATAGTRNALKSLEDDAHLYLDRPTQPHPRKTSAPRTDRPLLRECVTPMVLIGTLDMPRERGGFYGAELREAPTFDGVKVESPGYFRMLRAEDGVDLPAGKRGVLRHRHAMQLRGEMHSRVYPADKVVGVAPGLLHEQVFVAGTMKRTPFLTLTLKPTDFFAYLKGNDVGLEVAVRNDTEHRLHRLTLNLHGEPRDPSFPMQRRLDLEPRFHFTYEKTFDVPPRSTRNLKIRLRGKPDPLRYRQAEGYALGGERWPYPGLRAGAPERTPKAQAGQDLARWLPRRTLRAASGTVPRDCHQSALAVRYDREYRAYGVVLDGLDLEIMAGWNDRQDATFLRLLETRGHELPNWLRPVLASAMEAKDRRVPVVRRPGGFDEFDAMALHLWGATYDGSAQVADGQDQWGRPWDALYKHDGKVLPKNHRGEMRRFMQRMRGARRLAPGRAGRDQAVDYPRDDLDLPESVRRGLESRARPGRAWGRSRPAQASRNQDAALRARRRSAGLVKVRSATDASVPRPSAGRTRRVEVREAPPPPPPPARATRQPRRTSYATPARPSRPTPADDFEDPFADPFPTSIPEVAAPPAPPPSPTATLPAPASDDFEDVFSDPTPTPAATPTDDFEDAFGSDDDSGGAASDGGDADPFSDF